MAIQYDGTDDYTSHALSGAASSGQCSSVYTMACWVRRDAVISDLRPVMVRNNYGTKFSTQFDAISFGFDDLVGGGPSNASRLTAVSYVSSTSYNYVQMTYSTTIDVWYHVAGVFRRGGGGAIQLEIWVNGVQEALSTTVKEPTIYTRLSYAVLERATNTRFAPITIDQPAIWEASLDADAIGSLAAGAAPWEVCPAVLRLGHDFNMTPPRTNHATGATLPGTVPLTYTTGSAPVAVAGPALGQPGMELG